MLPNGSGKKDKVAVLCEPDKITEAKSSGAEIVGSDDLLEKIASGKFNFSKLVLLFMMVKLVSMEVLGPKGLMPNPKLGTVSNDIAKAVKNIKSGL